MKETSVIADELYFLVSQKLDKNSRKFKQMIGNFINTRHKELYATAPYDRIFFNKKDVENIFTSLGIDENEVKTIMDKSFLMHIDCRPKCAQEPYVQVLMCCIRYFLKNKDRQSAEITTIFTCFTGKFYASLHTNFWRTYTPSEAVMEYVINNMLSDKFDLKTEGTIFGAIKKLCITWIDKYNSKLTANKVSDDDFKQLIQQLRDREKSFLKNIANLYYEAVESKAYMNYETDSLDPDDFRITDSDALKAARLTEAAVGLMTSQKIDLRCVDNCHDHRVSSKNIMTILESILSDNENIPNLKWVVNVLICDFMSNYPGKEVGGADFLSYTMKSKPNTKNEYLLKMKQIVYNWLNRTDVFRKCKSDITMNSYYRSILMYFALMVSKVALKG